MKITAKIDDYAADMQEMYTVLSGLIQKFKCISKGAFLAGEYADWHLKGMVYHAEKLIKEYRGIVEELSIRLGAIEKADIFIMHTPQLNNFMYEFYAFINLARISLDNLRHLLYPLFTNDGRQLPKSITDLEKGFTDCPVYERIAITPELQYLIDLRNCIVHFRTFATSNNSVIFREGAEVDLEQLTGNNWTTPMAKGFFRVTETQDLVFNIFLPDTIYDRTAKNKKLSKFKYEQRINVLGESIRFLRYVAFNYMEAFALNLSSQEKRFTYRPGGGLEAEFTYMVF